MAMRIKLILRQVRQTWTPILLLVTGKEVEAIYSGAIYGLCGYGKMD